MAYTVCAPLLLVDTDTCSDKLGPSSQAGDTARTVAGHVMGQACSAHTETLIER